MIRWKVKQSVLRPASLVAPMVRLPANARDVVRSLGQRSPEEEPVTYSSVLAGREFMTEEAHVAVDSSFHGLQKSQTGLGDSTTTGACRVLEFRKGFSFQIGWTGGPLLKK